MVVDGVDFGVRNHARWVFTEPGDGFADAVAEGDAALEIRHDTLQLRDYPPEHDSAFPNGRTHDSGQNPYMLS